MHYYRWKILQPHKKKDLQEKNMMQVIHLMQLNLFLRRKLKLSEIDHIVFFEKPFLKFERLLETYVAFAPRGFKSFSMAMPIWLKEKLFQKNFYLILKNMMKIIKI